MCLTRLFDKTVFFIENVNVYFMKTACLGSLLLGYQVKDKQGAVYPKTKIRHVHA